MYNVHYIRHVGRSSLECAPLCTPSGRRRIILLLLYCISLRFIRRQTVYLHNIQGDSPTMFTPIVIMNLFEWNSDIRDFKVYTQKPFFEILEFFYTTLYYFLVSCGNHWLIIVFQIRTSILLKYIFSGQFFFKN